MWAGVTILLEAIAEAEIILQRQLAQNVYQLTVCAPKIAHAAEPGMFAMIKVPDGAMILRRPLGIADVDLNKGTLSFIYRVMGRGTKKLSTLTSGDCINTMGPLGYGFTLKAAHPLIVGGGMGLAPLLYYAKCVEGADILMGGRTAAEMFWTTLFKPYVSNIHITTDDGTMGAQGFAVDLLPQLLAKKDYDCIIACGPDTMLEIAAKIARKNEIPCQVSLEKRMGCGLGACLSCSVDMADGRRKKICKDGPVFWAEEVWQ